MNETTAIESIRIAARRGAAFAKLIGPVVAQAIPPITIEQDIPAGDRCFLNDNFGEISPAMVAAYWGAFEGGRMSPYYLKPHYQIASLVAEQVRAFDPDQWVVVGFFDFGGEAEPMTVRATDMKDLQPGEVGMTVRAGDWLADYDAEWAPYWDDGEPLEPDLIPHSNIYTEDYR